MLLAALLALSAPIAAERHCTISNAVPASVREMARAPERWLGRCVRVEGYALFNTFYADVAGFYASLASDRRDHPNDGWLGLYGGRAMQSRRLRQGSIAGVLRDCGRDFDAAMARSGPDDWVMSIGYCHYHDGLVLLPATFRERGPSVFERQAGEAARVRFGDLLPETAALRPPPDIVRLADRFLAALRAGDGAALRGITDPWSEQMPANASEEHAFTAYLLGEAGSPLAEIRAMPLDPQRSYFQERQDRDAVASGYAKTWHVCFCRGPDCRGRWPISAFDANAVPARPYVCLRAFQAASREGPPNRLAIERRDEGMREPPLKAFQLDSSSVQSSVFTLVRPQRA